MVHGNCLFGFGFLVKAWKDRSGGGRGEGGCFDSSSSPDSLPLLVKTDLRPQHSSSPSPSPSEAKEQRGMFEGYGTGNIKVIGKSIEAIE